jgi:hypothetical protein
MLRIDVRDVRARNGPEGPPVGVGPDGKRNEGLGRSSLAATIPELDEPPLPLP